MLDMEGANLKAAKQMSKKMSVMHSENVRFTYEYEVPNGHGAETVFISGQFNNWDFEEMQKDGKKYKIEKQVKGG